MALYNMSELQAVTRVQEVFVYANNSVNSSLTSLLMFGIFFILLMFLRRHEFKKALLTSSFICFTLGLILRFADLLPLEIVLVFLALFAGTALWSWMEN